MAETAPYFYYPFAIDGDVAAIPVTTQPGGSISYQQGYGPDYEKNLLTDPTALPIGRTTMNQLFFDITTLLQQYSQYGTPPFITTSQNQGTPFPYPIYARTYYLGNVYENQVANNTSTPGTDDTWLKISSPTVALYNYFSGFLSSDNGTNMVFGPGTCSDSTNSVTISSPTSFTKNMTAAWAAGSGNGGVPSGVTLATNTYYYDFVIAKADGTVDFGLDTDINATNLLADAIDFIYFRRVRAHFTQLASTSIETMNQIGREFYYVALRTDVNYSTGSPSDVDAVYPMSLPLIPVLGIFYVESNTIYTSSTPAPQINLYNSQNYPIGVNQNNVLAISFSSGGTNRESGTGEFRIISTDANLGINIWQTSTSSQIELIVSTGGWVDYVS